MMFIITRAVVINSFLPLLLLFIIAKMNYNSFKVILDNESKSQPQLPHSLSACLIVDIKEIRFTI